jgi:hypothetical protein
VIDSKALQADLKGQVQALERDLRRCAATPASAAALNAAWQDAKRSMRTADPYAVWLEDQVTLSAVAWVLATVFIRFCEDNRLIEVPTLAGPAGQLQFAVDRQATYLRRHPDFGDRDWIVAGLDALSASPTALRISDSLYKLMQHIAISHDAARSLICFWRRCDTSGELIHNFHDPCLQTKFLADLYAGISERATQAYALVLTPEFVADFLLDQVLDPAIHSSGLRGLRTIDPVCGSGELPLKIFERLHTAWSDAEPYGDRWCVVEQSLASVHGVDKNPTAVAITRFRLLIAAMKAGGARGLGEVPELPIIVATGDSLIANHRIADQYTESSGITVNHIRLDHEDLSDYADPGINLLGAGSYHVVVGNPPYLTVRDHNEDTIYRMIYEVCRNRYSLTVPFIVQFFRLGRSDSGNPGFVGTLVSNSFMKREFGRRLVKDFFPTVELTHLVDTSGAYIPGYGTPTVILLGRSRHPRNPFVRMLIGMRSEPIAPSHPAQGLVWQAITTQLDSPGSESKWIGVIDVERAKLERHPWSFADTTSMRITSCMEAGNRLRDYVTRVGYHSNTGSDDVFTAPAAAFKRMSAEEDPLVTIITGSGARDWEVTPEAKAFFPGREPVPLERYPLHHMRLWPYRTLLSARPYHFPGSYPANGRAWYDWHHVTDDPDAHPWFITFPWVATHNHFCMVRKAVMCLHSAPVIRFPSSLADTTIIGLAGALNSSAACFWLKQHSNSKGSPVPEQIQANEEWTHIYEFTSSVIAELPLPASLPTGLAQELDELAQRLAEVEPTATCATSVPTRERLDVARADYERVRGRMIALQEELDWDVYRRYGLLNEPDASNLVAEAATVPVLKPGERAFEILLARRLGTGEVGTQWFARHGSTPITEIPSEWPEDYRDVVTRRIEAIERSEVIRRVEHPEYKRRWQSEPWEKKEHAALRSWLLDRCEDRVFWYRSDRHGVRAPRTMTVNQLANRLQSDAEVTSVMQLFAGPDADIAHALREVIIDEHVPFLAQFRYHSTAHAKRLLWEKAWDLQREEDRTGRQVDIEVPPKYKKEDFLRISYWNQRGKLDVPRERFISYPGAGPDSDDSLLLGWAGWDYREQALALIELIEVRLATAGWRVERLTPLLAGLLEVMPWVRQWHNEIDPAFGISPAQEYDAYLTTILEECGLTEEALRNWLPPLSRRGRPRKTR